MGRWVAAGLLLLTACKAELSDHNGADAGQGSQDAKLFLDAPIDGQLILGAWGTPAPIQGADTALPEDDCTLSSSKLELYFKRNDADGGNLYMMTRATTSDVFTGLAALGTLNSTVGEESPRLSPDDLTLYFGRNGDIMMSQRTAIGQPWGAPTPFTVLNTAAYEKWGIVCSNGYAMVSRANGANGQDIYEGNITIGAPNAVTAFNTTFAEQGQELSADCLHIYFQSNRDNDQFDLFEATRTNATAAWQNPTKMVDFNTATFGEEDPWVSTDQRVFVFASDAAGNKDLYLSTR